MLILQHMDTDEIYEIESDTILGRHPSCELVLTHPRVSSRHASIEVREGAWAVRDMGSGNGTSVNGRRLRQWQRLCAGDRVRFAGVAFEVIEVLEPEDDGLISTQREQHDKPRPYHLVLQWTGPAEGILEVRHQGQVWRTEAGMPFVLLDLLAEAGDWVDDDDLKSQLWGRQGRLMSRSALHSLIYNTRRIFKAWGLDGGCVLKRRRRVRLAVQDVRRVSLPPAH